MLTIIVVESEERLEVLRKQTDGMVAEQLLDIHCPDKSLNDAGLMAGPSNNHLSEIHYLLRLVQENQDVVSPPLEDQLNELLENGHMNRNNRVYMMDLAETPFFQLLVDYLIGHYRG